MCINYAATFGKQALNGRRNEAALGPILVIVLKSRQKNVNVATLAKDRRICQIITINILRLEPTQNIGSSRVANKEKNRGTQDREPDLTVTGVCSLAGTFLIKKRIYRCARGGTSKGSSRGSSKKASPE
jgi:hypothetical protein